MALAIFKGRPRVRDFVWKATRGGKERNDSKRGKCFVDSEEVYYHGERVCDSTRERIRFVKEGHLSHNQN